MFSIDGITIKRDNTLQYDRKITFFTKEKGKMCAYAKSASKISSKLAPHCEPFGLVRFLIAPGKNVNHIAGAQLVRPFAKIRNNIHSLRIIRTVSGIINDFTKEHHSEPEVFDLLHEYCVQIEDSSDWHEERSVQASIAIFIWKFLSMLGYEPRLNQCARQHALQENAYFIPEENGAMCGVCSNGKASKLPVSGNSLSHLVQLLEQNKRDITKCDLPEDELRIIYSWYHWQCEEHRISKILI